MTTVAAVARDGVVAMAADSMTTVYDRPILSARKLARLRIGERRPYGEILLGVAGDGALPGLLEANLRVADQPNPDDGPGVRAWASAVARAVTEIAVGAGLVENGRMDSNVLLGWSGKLWTICHQQAIAHPDGVAALGSGEGPAIGAIDVLLEMSPDADLVQVVTLGVAAGIRRDKHSAGPINVELLGGDPAA